MTQEELQPDNLVKTILDSIDVKGHAVRFMFWRDCQHHKELFDIVPANFHDQWFRVDDRTCTVNVFHTVDGQRRQQKVSISVTQAARIKRKYLHGK